MFAPCLHWTGLRLSFCVSCLLILNSDIWFSRQMHSTHMYLTKWRDSLSYCCFLHLFYCNSWHVLWPLTLVGCFHFLPRGKWGLFWSPISCFCALRRLNLCKTCGCVQNLFFWTSQNKHYEQMYLVFNLNKWFLSFWHMLFQIGHFPLQLSQARIQVEGYISVRGNADLKLPAVVLENSPFALKSAPHWVS